MYWGSGLNALQILSIKKSSDFSTYLEDIDIHSDKDLYNYIGIICKEILEYINLKHSNYFNDYNLTTKKIKKIIKQYFFYIYDLQKEKNDVQFYNLLNKINGYKVNIPKGAFYFFPNIEELIGKHYKNDKINSASDLCMYYLNQAKVSLVPGEDFGAPNCIRLSYAASEKNLIEAVNRLKNSTNNLT